MQAITDDLRAILKAKFGAGASGFRGMVEIDHSVSAVGPAPHVVNVVEATYGNFGLGNGAYFDPGRGGFTPTAGNILVWYYLALNPLSLGSAGSIISATPAGWTKVGDWIRSYLAVGGINVDIPGAVACLKVSDGTETVVLEGAGSWVPTYSRFYVVEVADAADPFAIPWVGYADNDAATTVTGSLVAPSPEIPALVLAAFINSSTAVNAWSGTAGYTVPTSATYSGGKPNTFLEHRQVTDWTVVPRPIGTTAGSANLFEATVAFKAIVSTESTTAISAARRISIDKSIRMLADQAEVDLPNEELPLGWGAGSVLKTNSRIRVHQWFGDPANAVRTFTGVIDRHADARDPLAVTIACRDMFAILIDQTFSATAPQGASEAGAVRTAANGVYLSMEVSAIVADILDRAGWPTSDRAITPTSYVLSEYVLGDGWTWADAIVGADRLSGLVGYDAWADELGVFHFAPTFSAGALTDPGVPVYVFRSGEDILSLSDETDQYDLRTRVKVRGPLTTTTLTDTWREVWRTTKIGSPIGIWHDPVDTDNIRVLDKASKRLYLMHQSDQAVVSSVYLGSVISSPMAVSGDPSDSSIYWILNAPWYYGGATSGNSIKKVRKSDNVVLATYSLPDGRWTSAKATAAHLWLTNLDTDRFYSRSKADGSAVADYSHTISGVVQLNPSGLMVDGTTLYIFWYNLGDTPRFAVCDESAPGTVTKTVSTPGTQLVGGEMDTTTHVDCWGEAEALGLVAKFTLIDVSSQTNEVYAEVVDIALEDELGVLAGSQSRVHDAHPGDPSHAFEVRRDTVSVTAIVSLTQATETAMRRLDKVARRRRVLDAGIIGNPALQKVDLIRVEDPVTGLAEDWMLDTYRSEMTADGTYVGTIAGLPVTQPGDVVADGGSAS